MKSKFQSMNVFPLLMLIILGVFIGGMFYIDYRFEQRRANFYEQFVQRDLYRAECMNSALTATGNELNPGRTYIYIDHLSDAIESVGYQVCLRLEPDYPALAKFL